MCAQRRACHPAYLGPTSLCPIFTRSPVVVWSSSEATAAISPAAVRRQSSNQPGAIGDAVCTYPSPPSGLLGCDSHHDRDLSPSGPMSSPLTPIYSQGQLESVHTCQLEGLRRSVGAPPRPPTAVFLLAR